MPTDSYTVNPAKFPGGSIGGLAVSDIVNDLAIVDTKPLALIASFILEGRLETVTLRCIVASMCAIADTAGASVVAGDTEIMLKGVGDRVYITTVGVGIVRGDCAGAATEGSACTNIEAGDHILISGPIANRGMAVMLARGDLALAASVEPDTRAVNGLVKALPEAAPDIRWTRDTTRGGLGTVVNEFARDTGLGAVLDDESVVVHGMTHDACDMLGISPSYVVDEGILVAVVPAEQSEAALSALRAAGASEARDIGPTRDRPAASMVLVTGFGGIRMVGMLVDDPLPRIC